MAHSLGLKLYTLANRGTGADPAERPSRPPGRLVWLHAPGPDAARTMLELARRLVDEDAVPVLLTCPAPIAPHEGLLVQAPPADNPFEARAFLDHWRPEVAVFSEGELRPALMAMAEDRLLPMLMADARVPRLLRRRDDWYPGLMRSTLAGFQRVLAVDEEAARNFRKAGALAVAVTGRMEEESAALPCSEPERAALARRLSTRPVWLAVDVPEAEEVAVIAAQRSVLLLLHRALLILVPKDLSRADALAEAIAAEGWTVARRSADEEPDGETEVFLADGGGEYGLWYRLAPVTFLGGTLLGEGCSRDPLEAAALGSALISGPRSGAHAGAHQRLARARAIRGIGMAGELSDAVGDLLAPDRAARLAQAAWAASSDGAEATEKVLAEIRRVMDGGA